MLRLSAFKLAKERSNEVDALLRVPAIPPRLGKYTGTNKASRFAVSADWAPTGAARRCQQAGLHLLLVGIK